MAVPLPPTVYERLARCGERVYVGRLVQGATVELHVDNTVFTTTATSGNYTFSVPPLAAGVEVRARQDAGSGFTPFSPSIFVEQALVPPEAGPGLPELIGTCSQCVLVDHATPGATLELRVGGDVVGTGIADRHGASCVSVDLRKLDGRREANLLARQIVCGADGPDTVRTLTLLPSLSKPAVGDPVFGCQRTVPVNNGRPGARLAFETDGGDNLGSLCSCWGAVNVNVIRPLLVGEKVRVRAYYNAQPCDEDGPWSGWREVVPPDERIRPVVQEPLIEGDQFIRVENQIEGATLLVRIAQTSGQQPDEYGPAAASDESEIALAEPLKAGNVVTVVQTLCNVAMESEPVIVRPLPPEILAPVISPPLYHCGRAVQVSNLHIGALVRVFQDGIPVGMQWAGLNHSISVSVQALSGGADVTAIQWVGGKMSPQSAPVQVDKIAELVRPHIIGPVTLNDQSVTVSGVTPGAKVVILSGGVGGNPIPVGEVYAAEPIVHVPVEQWIPAIMTSAIPRVRLCDNVVTGESKALVRSPCGTLRNIDVAETTIEFGQFHVPPVLDGGDFDIALHGRLYAPHEPTLSRYPLVIIAHGWHTGYNLNTGDPVESFLGYEYLARHLVRWDMIVFSIDLQTVNDLSVAGTNLQQFARAEVIHRVIDELLGDNNIGRLIWRERIGLVGHSMGGEAVVVAQHLNVTENRGVGIRGVVSIAPTRWHPNVVMPAGRYMQLFGALDQLTGIVPNNDTPSPGGGMRFYDRGERDKTLFWIYGMRHNPINSLWVGAGDFAEEHLADFSLSESEHQRLARCLINAFFQDTLLNSDYYRGYMAGSVFPQSLRHLQIHTSYSREPRSVLDNFGDADSQAGITAESPLDKTTNSLGLTVDATGTGLADWEDVQHATLNFSPHSTAGVRLSWKLPEAFYSSDSGGVSGQPLDVITIRLAQFFEDAALNPEALPADAFVVLSDGSHEASVRLGALAPIPYPDATARVNTMMRTVRLPLDAFKAANPGLTLGNIKSVSLRFNARPTGHILADDIEFSPE
jgi:hypothetical protein